VLDSGQVVFSGNWQDFDDKAEIRNRYLAM
jgi:hypothetical protein